MHGMMDCCKAALMANDSPEIAAAKLCCAVGSELHGHPPIVDHCGRVVLAN
jgi:hypothetical protein